MIADLLTALYALRWLVLVVLVVCWTAGRVADWLDDLEQQHPTTRNDQDRNTP